MGCVVAERTEAVWPCYNWTGRKADLDLHQAVLRQWGRGWVGVVSSSLPGLLGGKVVTAFWPEYLAGWVLGLMCPAWSEFALAEKGRKSRDFTLQTLREHTESSGPFARPWKLILWRRQEDGAMVGMTVPIL